jgi:hypothetical protein
VPTDPLTGSRYPASSAAPNVAQDIQNAVLDLSDNTIPNFATTTARDSAYSAWVALGNAMRDGLHCHVQGVGDQTYLSGSWNTWTAVAAATNVATYIGTGSAVTSGPYDVFGYCRVGNRVILRGWLQTTATVAASTPLTAAFPTAVRPPKGRTIWPSFEVSGSQGASVRCEMFTDGKLYTARGVATGLFFSFDGLAYDL